MVSRFLCLANFAFLKGVMNRIACSVAFAAMGCAGVAEAGFVVGSASVSASEPDLDSRFPIVNLINQSGISAAYNSGVTDFNTFVGMTALSGNPSFFGAGGWASAVGSSFQVNIDFNLGFVQNLTRMALWNDVDLQGLGNFKLYASDNASFSSLTYLGSFTGYPGGVGHFAQVFDMTDATTQYIRVEGSPGGNDLLLNIGEIAFEGSTVDAVPEPTSKAIWGLGAMGLAFARRRFGKKPVDWRFATTIRNSTNRRLYSCPFFFGLVTTATNAGNS